MKGVDQIYGVKGKVKEENLGSMLNAFEQLGASIFSGVY